MSFIIPAQAWFSEDVEYDLQWGLSLLQWLQSWRLTEPIKQNVSPSENIIGLIKFGLRYTNPALFHKTAYCDRDHLRWVFDVTEFCMDCIFRLSESVEPIVEICLCSLQFGLKYFENYLQNLILYQVARFLIS